MKSTAADGKLASIVGGKSARACDNCARKRARWYCAADEAFLCHGCDSSVHSANPLARRHDRVRLKNATSEETKGSGCAPSWHQGFKRKARTPRQKKNGKLRGEEQANLVPEIFCEEENYEQLLFRVPILEDDPFLSELCNTSQEAEKTVNDFQDFVPSERDLAEFAADVECLLGKGFDDSAFDMAELGIFDFHEKLRPEPEFKDCGKLKIEEDPQIQVQNVKEDERFLKLDVDGVISAWDCRKSPWLTGERPKSIDFWTDFFGGNRMPHEMKGEVFAHTAAVDGGREARVSRYREKRRTRLFSKKIRYEVRKLNAEKRPRMKGRFVKGSSSFAAAPANFSFLQK